MPVPASFTGQYLAWGAASPWLKPTDPTVLTRIGRAAYVSGATIIGPLGLLYHTAQHIKCLALESLTQTPHIKEFYDLREYQHIKMANLDLNIGLKAALPVNIFITLLCCLHLAASASLISLIPIAAVSFVAGVFFRPECLSIYNDFIKDPTTFIDHFHEETKWYYQALIERNCVINVPLTDAEIMRFDKMYNEIKTYSTFAVHVPQHRMSIVAEILPADNKDQPYHFAFMTAKILYQMDKIEPSILEDTEYYLKGMTRHLDWFRILFANHSFNEFLHLFVRGTNKMPGLG